MSWGQGNMYAQKWAPGVERQTQRRRADPHLSLWHRRSSCGGGTPRWSEVLCGQETPTSTASTFCVVWKHMGGVLRQTFISIYRHVHIHIHTYIYIYLYINTYTCIMCYVFCLMYYVLCVSISICICIRTCICIFMLYAYATVFDTLHIIIASIDIYR